MADQSTQDLIINAALAHGVDPATMLAIAQIESNYNPNAYNRSGAAGLFQFMPSTAAQYGLSNPYDPGASANKAAQLAADNTAALTQALGRPPTAGEIYLAHQQGAQGAIDLLTHPDSPASSIVGRQAVLQNGGTAGMTAAQFANLWTNQADRAASMIPPMNIPEVGSAYADTSIPLPQSDPRNSALSAIDQAMVNNPASMPVPLAPYQGFKTGASAADDLALNPAQVNVGNDINNGALAWAGLPTYSGPSFSDVSPDLADQAYTLNGYDAGLPSGYGSSGLTEAQRLAMMAVPQSMPPLPMPDPRPPATDSSSILPTQVASATPSAQTVVINGHTYQVGQVLSTADGRSYQATPNGFVAMPHISLGTNTIAGGMAGQAVKDALANAQAQAPAALSGAASKIGGLFGGLTGLFGGTGASTPNGGNPVPPLDVPSSTASIIPQSVGPAGGYYSTPYSTFSNPGVQGLSPDDRDSSNPIGGPYNAIDAIADPSSGSSTPQSYGPAGGYYSTPYSTAPDIPQSSGPAGGYYSTPYDTSEQPTDLGMPGSQSVIPKTITTYQTQQTLNPAYTAWVNSQGAAINGVEGVDTPSLDASGNVVLPSSYLGAAPPQYITTKVPVVKPNPAYVAPVPIDTRPKIGGIPIGHPGGLLSLLGGIFANNGQDAASTPVSSSLSLAQQMSSNPGGLTKVQQLQAAYGLSPSQAYSMAAGPAQAQGANPNPIMALLTGSSGPPPGQFLGDSNNHGSPMSPFH